VGEVVKTEIIPLEKAPKAYQTVHRKKFVIDPHGSVKKVA
jgi:hypothetical protein